MFQIINKIMFVNDDPKYKKTLKNNVDHPYKSKIHKDTKNRYK